MSGLDVDNNNEKSVKTQYSTPIKVTGTELATMLSILILNMTSTMILILPHTNPSCPDHIRRKERIPELSSCDQNS